MRCMTGGQVWVTYRGGHEQGPVAAAIPIGGMLGEDAEDGALPALDVLGHLILALPVGQHCGHGHGYAVARHPRLWMGALLALVPLSCHTRSVT